LIRHSFPTRRYSDLEDAEIAVELDRAFSFGNKEFDDDLLAIQYRYDDELGRRVKYFLKFRLIRLIGALGLMFIGLGFSRISITRALRQRG
jgi:hypothetical protein